MPQPVPETIKDQWKECVFNQRQSGLSIAAWCRHNNITPHTFYYWRDKFFPKTSVKRADFKEISEHQNIVPQSSKSGVCLQYREICIHLDQQFDVVTLKECLQILKELPC